MALISDPSLEGFNSYVSVEEADDYFAGTYFGDSKTWSDQGDKQEALLITATRRLNALPWSGSTYAVGQVLAFPRRFYDVSEYGVGPSEDPVGEIPAWLKQATLEMAMWLWTEEDRPAEDLEMLMLKSQKLGPVDQVFRDMPLGLPPSVAAILKAQGSSVIGMNTGARSMSIVL